MTRGGITFIGVAIATFVIWICYVLYRDSVGHEEYRAFYHAEVVGKIRALSFSKGVCYVMLYGSDKQWVFYDKRPDNATYPGFAMNASRGDSIIKHAEDETIYLHSGGKVYEYRYIIVR